jgi:hypothetical protein
MQSEADASTFTSWLDEKCLNALAGCVDDSKADYPIVSLCDPGAAR